MFTSRTLFDSSTDWRTQPLIAFADFVRSTRFVELGMRRTHSADSNATPTLPLRASSANVYLQMFGAFIRWLATHNKTVFDVTVTDLENFLDQGSVVDGQVVKKLNSSIRLRYLRLIERVLTHVGVVPNPAQHICFTIHRQRHSEMAGEDAAKAVLSDAEQTAFMQALPAPVRTSGKPTSNSWKRRRDRAMQALMLGAGLKVSEVVALRLNQIGALDSSGSVPILLDRGAANSVTRAHRTQLRPFAATEVLNWVATRRTETVRTNLLFPAAPDCHRMLDSATVYRQVKATFARAGIDPKRWGGRTLRNTFAVRELAETGSVELVGEFLGHRLERSTLYYQEAAQRRVRESHRAAAGETIKPSVRVLDRPVADDAA